MRERTTSNILLLMVVASGLILLACSGSESEPTALPASLPAVAEESTQGKPSTSAPTQATPSGLAGVSSWLYLIDDDLEPETVDRIVDSEYDMVVLDYVPSEENNQDYPMAEVVARLQQAPHPKIVIAYIDTGQAEDYRTYWEPGWRIGDPKWITALDPDGWEGNFPVAFWHEEWRDIWLSEDGYLNSIVADGFDGVYLDWVEAYSDENVLAAAEEAGVNPIEETIRWVGDIARFTRLQNPGFIVIGQNAAKLAERGEYLEIIDAIAQEQVWFDGGADNDPPGDCPLPSTDAGTASRATTIMESNAFAMLVLLPETRLEQGNGEPPRPPVTAARDDHACRPPLPRRPLLT